MANQKLTGYIANNLNGKAAATYVKREGKTWVTMEGYKVTGKVYDTPEQAKAAARRKWFCK